MRVLYRSLRSSGGPVLSDQPAGIGIFSELAETYADEVVDEDPCPDGAT